MAQNHANFQGCAGLLPLYDPSLLSSDLLTCAVKEEGFNLMGYVGGGGGGGGDGSSSSHHSYLDPNSSFSPFMFTHQNLHNLRDFDHSFNGADVLAFKPEPLSLSLSSNNNSHQNNNLPLDLNLQKYGSSMCTVPVGPFTGYASILKGSRFLKPAQQLLDEISDVGRGIYIEKLKFDCSSLIDPSIECLGGSGIADDDSLNCVDVGEHRKKKSKLISLLDEVYRRYKQYYQHMQAVVESFEYVAGLGNAAPYANLALKAMYKHFKCLKNAITDQLQLTNKGHALVSPGKDEDLRLGNSDRNFYGQRPVNSSGYMEHQPVWRPQRGLPERAVAVLRAWLFEHFLHPYPTDTDKLMLAKQTGLSRSQVSNWFINARVRLWKPMVEEIHMLETRQAQKASQRDERNAGRSNDQLPSTNSFASDIPSTSTQWLHDTPQKRTRKKLPDIPGEGDEPLNLSYNNLSSHPQVGVGVSMTGGNSSVSLTLGLHQNNATGLSELYPINAAQRLGIGVESSSNDSYVMANFGMQNRHFGRDSIGGQLLHDFVG